MFKFIKKTVVKITVLIILLVGCILGFAFRAEVKLQLRHAIAYHNVNLGDDKFKKGKYQEAINYYNYALKLYPEHVNARYNLGNIYMVYEDYSNAVLCYEEALKYAPNFINAHINLAIVLAEQFSDFDRAIEEYQKVVDYKPLIIKIPFIYNNEPYLTTGKAVAYYNMGLAYKAKSLLVGDDNILSSVFLRKAADSYREALKIDPKSYETYYNLGIALQLLKSYTESKKAYCTAIGLKPLDFEAHYNLAILFRELRQYDHSVAELEKAGLILDAGGDGYITRYIYDVLNEVYQQAQIKQEYLNMLEKKNGVAKTKDEQSRESQATYLNGKFLESDELDRAMIENMKKCGSSIAESDRDKDEDEER